MGKPAGFRFRSTHIPLSYVHDEQGKNLLPNRALTSWNREGFAFHEHITRHVPFEIPQHLQFDGPSIALKVYRDEELWWLLAVYNGIVWPTRELYAGRVIEVPLLSEVKVLLDKANAHNQETKTEYV